MGLEGVAAMQERIAQIQAQIASISPSAAPAASSSAANAGSPEFASLLENAIATSSDASAAGIGSLDSPTGSGTDLLGTMGSASGSASGLVGQLTQLAQLAQGAQSGLSTTAPTASNGVTQQFLAAAMAQRGKPYVYGATAAITDPNPKAFDCSELTKWAAARAGVTIPDGATAQYLYIRDHGTKMSVEQALHTPGALLFHFGHEPKNLGDIPADGHVAISLGDGVHTIEARGHKYGTNIFTATGTRAGFFNDAGMIPGMT